jgi:glycine/D-amino acid oxidase-like deaminating enzyme
MVYWLQEFGARTATQPLAGDVRADVVIVGGGYAGLWTAWALRERAPDARIVVLEARACGDGPSGRNAGFVNPFWHRIADLVAEFGDVAALEVCREASRSVDAIGAWADEQEIDVWYRKGGHLKAAANPAQDGRWRASVEACARLGVGEEFAPLSVDGVRSRCSSPRLGAGALMRGSATVHPARLALGLRDALVTAGVDIHEWTRARRIDTSGEEVVVEADGGRVLAPAAVIAINAAAAGFRPLRGRLAVTSTQMVITEPVPDVLERAGWTGDECISTAATYSNYFRTTPDRRIAFGWGGGRIAYGARLGGRIQDDAEIAERVRADLLTFFPDLHGRRIAGAWGGPVDVSPIHLPEAGTLPDGRIHYVHGFTGNGVGPAHLAGRILASLALDRRDQVTRLALVEPTHAPVPPEPIRYLGGTLVRAALVRKEEREDAGLAADPLTDMVIGLPRRLGIHIGR